MAGLDTAGVIDTLKNAAAVIEVTDNSPQKRFKVRAYQTAIESLNNLDQDLQTVVAQNQLDDVPGIGKELTEKITQLVSNGNSTALDKLFAQVPAGMFTLLQIPGVGPQKAFKLASTFQLDNPDTTLDILKQKIDEGEVTVLPGFGTKSVSELKDNLTRLKPKAERLRLDQADALALDFLQILEGVISKKDIYVLGSLRRRDETIGDVDLALKTSDPSKIINFLKHSPSVTEVSAAGKNLIRVLLKGNKQVDVKFQSPDKFGATLQHFTGNKSHNIALREFALKQGKSLSEHGIKVNGKLQSYASEEAFYKALNLDWIPPEIRHNTGEIQAAANHELPPLVTLSDIKGDVHNHSNFSMVSSHDVGMPIHEALSQAEDNGYEWYAIGDHNPSQTTYKDNMNTIINQRNLYIEQQYYAYLKQSPESKLKILKTMEVDILPDGHLAVPDEALMLLDFVIISIHSQFYLPLEKQTDRLLKAMSHPKVKIIGHPTGRLINERASISVDWSRIFKACHSYHIAVEINANPHRLDLPDTLVREALTQGVVLSLGTDAHDAKSLSLMPYGVSIARRGWATKRDIINTYSYLEFINWLAIKES